MAYQAQIDSRKNKTQVGKTPASIMLLYVSLFLFACTLSLPQEAFRYQLTLTLLMTCV